MRYYQEPNGDYLYVDYHSGAWYRAYGEHAWEARSAAIEHLPSSVCTLTVNDSYLKKCKLVRKADVPAEWLAAIKGE